MHDPVAVLEREAIDAYLAGADEASEELWARAHSACLAAADPQRAARCVFWIVLDLFNRGQWARGNGWLARAERVLEAQPDSPEHGLLAVLAARQHMKHGDVDAAASATARATHLASRFDDAELDVFSRLAMALVHARSGRFAEAAAIFDEIMVAVTVDVVSPIAVGVVYCAVIDACHSLFDVGRAREWTEALTRWCASEPNTVAFRGKCMVHHAEILRGTGAWEEALAEAQEACTWSATHADSFTYPVASAFYELAELQRLRGDFAAAEAAYHRASEHGHVPEPGLTLLHLEKGEVDVARARIQRLLNERLGSTRRAAVLHAAAAILTDSDDVATARAAADELAHLSKQFGTPAVRALAAEAAGAVELAESNAREALVRLRTAWQLWQDLAMPYEAARVRVLLGKACLQLGDESAAGLEFDAARRVFQRLLAAPDVARVDALRPQKEHGASSLTTREMQVIQLVARGATNRAIAHELSISERTVDRHVSNILMKLDLPSRSAATAYAFQHHLV